MASGQGDITFSFGAAPGGNVATATVTGQTNIKADSKIELYMMGTDSTVTHNAYEHSLLPLLGLSLTATSINPGAGFTAMAACASRLSGDFKVRYVWAD